MSSRDRRDDDLEERLDELESVLSELRADLRENERDRRGPPRPPRLSELVRFTEQYTIPTLIALLETTIKSLELLRGTLRLADPGRSVAEGTEGAGDRLADVRDGATAGLARSLSELRTALSEADLPEDAASRSIIADARDLTAEIESRIDEGRREADAARDRRLGRDRDRGRGDEDGPRSAPDAGRDDDSPVRIDVTEPGDGGDGDAESEEDDPPEVDVESELESIKRQIDGDAAGDETDAEAVEADDAHGDGDDGSADDDADGRSDGERAD
ncbi:MULTISPECIES: hypothetical protein [Halorubrum]|jgi:hypothetical protein|uniref:Uncharacterized protein n=1 Tax=Halorubrum tropicale TaxID=1765655 RepID=A0A0N0UB23_9EURY|nr:MULTISPECIES: hypothetical protein [Halorubrum]KOX97990.1 hypothetical protein AMR74_03560 [Halorubrum tropicale]RLM50530.1 hypothetical protein DVK06_09825 [Halorubrum sp. Atlit-28R]TKX42399.1 hypothetical protein EXE50_14505 [Halorubrum sp. ARQ200]TKX58305.1 hypothetical protein EXE48_16835 [Halorubrum sp. ASP1]